MDQNQAETFLVSQTKKRDGGITEQQAKVLLQIWKMHRTRVHESVLRSCVWNNRLHNISWRIDVKSRSRAVEQLSAATAVVELELENSNANSQVWEFQCVLTDAILVFRQVIWPPNTHFSNQQLRFSRHPD